MVTAPFHLIWRKTYPTTVLSLELFRMIVGALDMGWNIDDGHHEPASSQKMTPLPATP